MADETTIHSTTATGSSAPESASPAGDAIGRWLDIFAPLLHLPDNQRESIRDELESHLRERTRDLMLAGRDEDTAIRSALSELGESALLAQRFEHAERRFRTRRTMMNIATFGIAGAAVVAASTLTSVSILNLHDDPRIAVYERAPAPDAEMETAASKTIRMEFIDTPLEDVFHYLGDVTDADVYPHWHIIRDLDLRPDEPVTLTIGERPLAESMDLLFHSIRNGEDLDWRLHDGLLEFATTEYFDMRERILVTFEIGDILNALDANPFGSGSASEQIRELVYCYVEPISWEANGGNLAQLRIVGNKMFIKAPPRFMEPISWILGQLEDPDTAKGEDDIARLGEPDGMEAGQ